MGRKEYEEGEIINCPRCDSNELDVEAPDKAKCLSCGLEFTIKKVAVWDEFTKDEENYYGITRDGDAVKLE